MFTHRNYTPAIKVGLSSKEVRPIDCVLGSGGGPVLIRGDVLSDEWLPAVNSEQRLQLRSATNHKLTTVGTITLHMRMGEVRVRVFFGAVYQLAVPNLLGTELNDKYVRAIFPGESKILPYNSERAHITAVSEEAETEKERPVRVARTTTLLPCSETPVLVSTSSSGIIEPSPLQGSKKHSNHMTAFGIRDIFLNRPFRIVVANSDSIVYT